MEEIELINVYLGLSPYVLLEAYGDEEDELALRIRAGGGCSDIDSTIAMMLVALNELTGVDPSGYAQEIDAFRRANGGIPLKFNDQELPPED